MPWGVCAAIVAAGGKGAAEESRPPVVYRPPPVDYWASGFDAVAKIASVAALSIALVIGGSAALGAMKRSAEAAQTAWMSNCAKSFTTGQCEILYENKVDAENAEAMSAAAMGLAAGSAASSAARR